MVNTYFSFKYSINSCKQRWWKIIVYWDKEQQISFIYQKSYLKKEENMYSVIFVDIINPLTTELLLKCNWTSKICHLLHSLL